jgi:hypothetical protein
MEPDVIPDPAALAAHLRVGTLVLIVGGEQSFVVAVTGSPQTMARMVDAYRKAGLPVQVVADIRPIGGPDQTHRHPLRTGAHSDTVCVAEFQKPSRAEAHQAM